MTWRDLTALPCSHPHCCSVGYLLRDDGGTWRSLTSLVGHDRLKELLELQPDVVANRIADDALPKAMRAVVKDSLLGLLSEQSSLSHPDVGQLLEGRLRELRPRHRHAAHAGRRARCRGSGSGCGSMLGERVLRVTVKPFMDMSTMVEERLLQCCVHVATVRRALRGAPVRALLRGPGLGPAVPHPDLDRHRRPRPTGGDVLVTAAAPPTPTAAAADRRRPTTRCGCASSRRSPCMAWLAGPFAVVFFAGLGFAGYLRARRAGLERSKCVLRDTRLVLAYLGLLAVAGAVGAALSVLEVLGVR